MEQLQRLKKFGTIAAIIAVIGFVYFGFIKKDEVPDLQAQEETVVPGSRDLLAALQTLNTIKLDGQIFKTNVFKSLEDRTIPREPKNPEGRINPFAPIGVDSGSLQLNNQSQAQTNTTTTTTTQTTQQPQGTTPTPPPAPAN